MSNVQFIQTNSGRMVVLPESDFNILSQAAEDLADIQSYDAAKSTIESGEVLMIPAEFANRLIDGENPIRVWRQFRKMSAKDLSAKAEISAAYLSEIETGKKEGGIATLKSIAAVLDVDLDDLV